MRDGRLAGVRIGKQYRIARADLETFTGGGATDTEAVAPAQAASRRVDVSSVIQLDGLDAEAVDRLTRTVEAVMAGRAAGDTTLRVEPVYDADRGRLKLIVVGGAADTVEIIRLVDALS